MPEGSGPRAAFLVENYKKIRPVIKEML